MSFFLGDGDKLLPAGVQGIILQVKAYVAAKCFILALENALCGGFIAEFHLNKRTFLKLHLPWGWGKNEYRWIVEHFSGSENIYTPYDTTMVGTCLYILVQIHRM